jgi:large subunit ribosomal protein L22
MAKIKETEKIEEPKVRAVAKYIRVSPFKIRPVIGLIKGKPVDEAVSILRFSRKGVATHVLKVLNSAAANAQNNDRLRAKPEELIVSEAYINEGPTLKRIRYRAMGRVTGIRKRTSHITIVLSKKEEA